jgi:hypothetical protein
MKERKHQDRREVGRTRGIGWVVCDPKMLNGH